VSLKNIYYIPRGMCCGGWGSGGGAVVFEGGGWRRGDGEGGMGLCWDWIVLGFVYVYK